MTSELTTLNMAQQGLFEKLCMLGLYSRITALLKNME
jgi:hypothetical protein